MIQEGQFQSLHERLNTRDGRKSGGFTVNVGTGDEPTSGIAVGIPGHERQIPSRETTVGDLRGYVHENAETLRRPGMHFGGWKPRGTTQGSSPSEVSLDVSRVVPVKESSEYPESVMHADAVTSAYDLMHAYDQEASFDLGTFKEIRNPGWNPEGRRGQG